MPVNSERCDEHRVPHLALPDGLIFEVARDAGVIVPEKGEKRAVRCPFHDDRTASAFLSARNIFFCSVCTPGGGWSAKRFAQELKADWNRYTGIDTGPAPRRSASTPKRSPFTAQDAQHVWDAAYARMRDDDSVERDRDVWRYLEQRALTESFELGAFGIIAEGMSLPAALASWAAQGYRVVAPLFDQRGAIANVQARAIVQRDPKTLFPSGSAAAGTVFACPRGRELLAGSWYGAKRLLYAEGLTDYLALTIASPIPVLAAPGTSLAASGVGSWVAGTELFIALDWDAAGETALHGVASRAFQFGATRVRRIDWPREAKDACQVVERIGLVGLESFLRRVTSEASP